MKKKFAIFMLLLSISYLVGCNHSDTKKSDVTESVVSCSGIGALCKKGIVFEKDSLLHFADFESKSNIILCNKPNCKHIPYSKQNNPDPYCDAALPYDSIGTNSFIYKNMLYTFVNMTTKTELYARTVDGGSRRKVLEFPYAFAFSNIIVKDNKAYLIALENEKKNKEINLKQDPFILEVDLVKHFYKALCEPKHALSDNIIISSIEKNSLYYQDTYLENKYKNYSVDQLSKLDSKSYTSKIYSVNLNTDKEKCIVDNDIFENYSFHGVYKGYYFTSKDNQLFRTRIDNKEQVVLWKGDQSICSAQIYDGYMILTTGKWPDIQRYIYYLDNNKVKKINRPKDETDPIIYANDIILFGNLNTMGFKALNMRDYIAGKVNYIAEYESGD